jgi:hypothetical protein
VNRIDQETEKEARVHKGCRAIREEEEEAFTSRQLFHADFVLELLINPEDRGSIFL